MGRSETRESGSIEKGTVGILPLDMADYSESFWGKRTILPPILTIATTPLLLCEIHENEILVVDLKKDSTSNHLLFGNF